jgi:PAS domain-containing protein
MIWQVISPECREHCAGIFEELMSGRPVGQIEVIFRSRAGRDIQLEGCVTLCMEPGFPIHTRGIFRDITARKEAEKAREKLIAELQQALQEIRTLRGLIPLCAWCKKFRNDTGYWQQMESYLADHTEASFSHGICPDCLDRQMRSIPRK